MRRSHQQAVAERTVRLVVVGASICVVLLLALLACLLVVSILYPELTGWLLGNEQLLN